MHYSREQQVQPEESSVEFVTNAADTATESPGWRQVLAFRLREMVLLRAFGAMSFMVVFFIAYIHLLHDPIFPVTTMPLTPIDHWIGFEPSALFLYITLWVYVLLPPALLPTRSILISYGLAIGALCTIGLLIFLFWPTAVPAPKIDWARYPAVAMLKGVDGAGNACPSLHVATAVFSGIWLHCLLRDVRSPVLLQLFNVFWCLAIVYSTMATKQHVFLDVAAGAMLGIVMAIMALTWLLPSLYDRKCLAPS